MPNFITAEKDLHSHLGKWLYVTKNVEDFQTIPAIFENEEFLSKPLNKQPWQN